MQRSEPRNCANFRAAVLVVIGVLGSWIGCSGRVVTVAEAAPTVGSSLNTSLLKLVDLDGKPFDLRKSSEGRVHVALFTRSDCPVSNQLAPECAESLKRCICRAWTST